AVRGNLQCVEHPQTVRGKHRAHRREREVRKVLVIDRVELVELHELHEVRKFERKEAVGGEQLRNAGYEVVQVRNVREHVVAEDQVGGAVLGAERLRRLLAEKLHDGGDLLLDRGLRNACSRLDAEAANARGDEVLEQVAIVARNLDDEVVFADAEIGAYVVDVFLRVRDPAV